MESVGRRGKYLLVELDSGDTLAMHLRMTGRLHWRPPRCRGRRRGALPARLARPRRREHPDLRRHAALRARVDRAGDPRRPRGLLGGEGRDRAAVAALHRPCARALLDGRRGPIKAVLLNQALVAGLGNMYVDEALFQARIHPERPAGTSTTTRSGACTGRSATGSRPPSRRAGPRSTATATRSAGRARCRTSCGCTCTRASRAPAAAPRSARPASPSAAPTSAPPASRSPAVVSEVTGVRVGHWTDAAARHRVHGGAAAPGHRGRRGGARGRAGDARGRPPGPPGVGAGGDRPGAERRQRIRPRRRRRGGALVRGAGPGPRHRLAPSFLSSRRACIPTSGGADGTVRARRRVTPRARPRAPGPTRSAASAPGRARPSGSCAVGRVVQGRAGRGLAAPVRRHGRRGPGRRERLGEVSSTRGGGVAGAFDPPVEGSSGQRGG